MAAATESFMAADVGVDRRKRNRSEDGAAPLVGELASL
jgi:hypothetical protein